MFENYRVQRITPENYKLWQAGVRRSGMWEKTDLAEKCKVANIRHSKFLCWKWKTEEIDQREWLNKCILAILAQDLLCSVYRIIEHNMPFDDDNADPSVFCVWEAGVPTRYEVICS